VAWQRSEARIGRDHVALRDAQDLRVVRVADGGTVWRTSSPTPVAGIELAGDLLVVSADRLTARTVATGEQAWQAPIRGARLGVAQDGTVVAANEQSVSAVDLTGRVRWQVKLPDAVTAALPDRVTVQDGIAYVTFRPRPERQEPLDADVLAIMVN
jgi:outer membrane protein assembly factor BamB